jgi:hypothetical protein
MASATGLTKRLNLNPGTNDMILPLGLEEKISSRHKGAQERLSSF